MPITREGSVFLNNLGFGRGHTASPVTYYVGLLTTGLSLSAASTISNLASGEVAASNGYARQILGTPIASISGSTITTSFNHRLSADNQVFVVTTNTLPTGLALATNYFCVSPMGANTLTLSATQGGSAISPTGGSGTHYLRAVPIFDTGADNRAEAIEDLVQFTASGGDITFQGHFLLAQATGTRGNTTGVSIMYEYYASSITITSGSTQLIRVRAYSSDRGTAVGSTT